MAVGWRMSTDRRRERSDFPKGGNTLPPQQRRALRLIARGLDGCTETVPFASGFKTEILSMLAIDGVATARPERVRAGKRPTKVVRMQITAAGRVAG
jgi:hypothetical protein